MTHWLFWGRGTRLQKHSKSLTPKLMLGKRLSLFPESPKGCERLGYWQICKLLGVKRLGLSLTEQFDGYYEFQGKTRYVEITELLDKGRRRGDEYASGSMVGSLPINTEDIRVRILDVVRGKSKRSKLRFESGKVVDLIVYQNLNIYRNVTAEIEEGVWSAFSFQHPFARIYVLNQLHNVILGYLMKKGTQTECIHLVKNSEGGGKRRDQ